MKIYRYLSSSHENNIPHYISHYVSHYNTTVLLFEICAPEIKGIFVYKHTETIEYDQK